MEFIYITILGILGAGLIVGGIVLYCKSTSANAKALAAASMAAGIVMWGLILLVTPVSRVIS